MALAKAGILGDISTGDIGIDLLKGGIGNHGISGDQLSKIFGAQARVEAIQKAREREENRKRFQLAAIFISVISSILFIVLLFYIFNKPSKPTP